MQKIIYEHRNVIHNVTWRNRYHVLVSVDLETASSSACHMAHDPKDTRAYTEYDQLGRDGVEKKKDELLTHDSRPPP